MQALQSFGIVNRKIQISSVDASVYVIENVQDSIQSCSRWALNQLLKSAKRGSR